MQMKPGEGSRSKVELFTKQIRPYAGPYEKGQMLHEGNE